MEIANSELLPKKFSFKNKSVVKKEMNNVGLVVMVCDSVVAEKYSVVRSTPIVEDCNGVRFAPYVLDYEGIERDLKESSLDEETGNWANMDDLSSCELCSL
ncbi:hypothetical protein GIB67_013883 [Kingdonia uniflora]|uniref:C-CAP/cofactor C-like domain-containing protein n=1 Tax=Kingdonia uniflora TaxID=39325 RepID=A0A7J7LDH9_9MAGN|nr:hypothetical protein GIB67_013883 [Kingdonia uniflora]